MGILSSSVLRRGPAWLLVPALLVMAVGFVIPLGEVAQWASSPELYIEFFEPGNPYRLIMIDTFMLSIGVALLTVALAYPVAYYLTRTQGLAQKLLLIGILTPLWVSVLIRTYGWIVVLGRGGLVNSLLMALNVTDQPVQLLYTRFAVYVAMIQVLLPIAVLMLYGAMASINDTFVKAARSLGASAFNAFRYVFFPMTANAVIASGILIFVLSLGFFITPALVGGPSDVLISNVIQTQVNETMDWELAATLGVILLAGGAILVAALVVLVRKALQSDLNGGVK
ncbi:ABC transporter permease [Bordetella trematum]|uniref:ABC transporter permease n=1 Tax=Bordetella trematum TaxID=123899 RepID=A0A157SFN3_9BORD|nr:ABC transporter permease [Bordetella trematum]SAI54708.1 ABC transporter permease [Bordetella trematum]SAI61834.1 ABC transporter permease [Bordetella trematum]SAI69003.1 ABC transporter permease [Bordetella trematum]SUV99459.1 ABC transporter permease [Bordetella trematum]